MGRAFLAMLGRDCRLALRGRAEVANRLFFFVLVAAVFPLGMDVDPALLRAIGPGVVWVAALLATVLSLEALFRGDFEDGSLEQLALSPQPLTVLVLAKVLAHWLVTGLPVVAVSPLIGTAFGLNADALLTLAGTLLLGTPVLSLIGAVGTGLTVGLRRGGVVLTLLVLPLYVPVLVFGANAARLAATGVDVTAPFYILGALLALAVTLAPLAAAAALRISLE
jgi:heme exporter protein B